MNAVTYPEPAPEVAQPRVTQLPQPARSRLGLYAAFGVVALLGTAVAAFLLWPQAAAPQAELIVTGAAEQVVTAFLHGDRPTLERLVAVETPDTLQADQSYVRSATAITVRATATGWEVVVAADHLVAVPGGFGNPRIEHFSVVFHDRPTGAIAAGLPSLVPAPEAPTVRAAVWPRPPADDMTATIEHYFAWLLAGEPGPFAGTPVEPVPFTNAAVVGMQRTERDGGFDVLVAVDAIRADGSMLPLHYSLRLEPSETRWVVTRPGD